MAADWEVGYKKRERRMCGLGLETTQTKCPRETCSWFVLHPANQQQAADPSCRVSHCRCHFTGRRGGRGCLPGPRYHLGGMQGKAEGVLGTPGPVSHAPNLNVAKDSVTLAANAGAMDGLLWDQSHCCSQGPGCARWGRGSSRQGSAHLACSHSWTVGSHASKAHCPSGHSLF